MVDLLQFESVSYSGILSSPVFLDFGVISNDWHAAESTGGKAGNIYLSYKVCKNGNITDT